MQVSVSGFDRDKLPIWDGRTIPGYVRTRDEAHDRLARRYGLAIHMVEDTYRGLFAATFIPVWLVPVIAGHKRKWKRLDQGPDLIQWALDHDLTHALAATAECQSPGATFDLVYTHWEIHNQGE